MIRLGPFLLILIGALAVVFIVAVPHWNLPVPGTQLGPAGTSMVQFAPTERAARADIPPPALAPAQGDPRGATDVYKNVTVLTDLRADAFMRLQRAMTTWVSPQQGCGFCHVGSDYASDAKPAKQVTRIMLQMTRHLNADWRAHLQQAGVTCYTCHRGQPAPSEVYFPSPIKIPRPFIAKQENYNENALTVREFFPREGWSEYLLLNTPALGQSYTALPSHEVASQKEFKRIYEFMMQFSEGIGVNCGYCHNSRAFADWSQSTPNRWIGYAGIQMTRDINRNFLLKLASILPEQRIRPNQPHPPVLPSREENPLPGNALATCATCHHGTPHPLGGADVVKDYPALNGPSPLARTTPSPSARFPN